MKTHALQKGVVWLLPAILIFRISIFDATAQTSAANVNQHITPRANEYMDSLVKAGWFNGSILIAQGGQVVVSRAYGMANFELDVPNTPHTKFRVGSITKPFTAMAIMLLQERGKINVQDSICKYMPDCPAAWQPITIHHLLSHTSGLAKHDRAREYLKIAMMPMTVTQLIDTFKNKPADFKPGEKFDYNNNGYILLGYVIEKVSGQSYETFLRENIFSPLKMMDTGYDNHTPLIKHRAAGYVSEGGKLLNAVYVDQSQPFAAGALYSTTQDLLRLDQALYDGKFLAQKTLDMMFTPAIGDYGPALNYGYGWFVNQQLNRRSISHPGGLPGFASMITRYPDDKVLIVVLSNLQNSQIVRASRDLAAIVFGEKYELPKVRTAVEINPKIIRAYVGDYEDRPGRVTRIFVENDTLMLKLARTAAGEQDPIPMKPESETQFFDPLNDIQVAFIKDTNGEVSEMILRLSGREFRAKKIIRAP